MSKVHQHHPLRKKIHRREFVWNSPMVKFHSNTVLEIPLVLLDECKKRWTNEKIVFTVAALASPRLTGIPLFSLGDSFSSWSTITFRFCGSLNTNTFVTYTCLVLKKGPQLIFCNLLHTSRQFLTALQVVLIGIVVVSLGSTSVSLIQIWRVWIVQFYVLLSNVVIIYTISLLKTDER